ncbi:hypothetical protein MRX96_005462 [Rhipicephalus microplus]
MQIAFLKKRGGLLRDIEWPQAEQPPRNSRLSSATKKHPCRRITNDMPQQNYLQKSKFIEDNDSHLDQQPLMWTLLFKWVECELPRHQGSLTALQQHVQDHFSMLPTFELLIYRAEEPPAVGLTKSIVQAFSPASISTIQLLVSCSTPRCRKGVSGRRSSSAAYDHLRLHASASRFWVRRLHKCGMAVLFKLLHFWTRRTVKTASISAWLRFPSYLPIGPNVPMSVSSISDSLATPAFHEAF